MLKSIPKNYHPVLFFNSAYLLMATVYFVFKANYEFILYAGVVLFFFFWILMTIEANRLSPKLLWMLSFWGLFHMLGGAVKIDSERVLYDFVFIELATVKDVTLLRYDHVIHFYGFMTSTFVGFHFLRSQLKENYNHKVIMFLVLCIGMGLGALNEVVEFIAVLTTPESGVGGYTNTAFDLVFNMAGAIAAAIYIRMNEGK